MSAVRLDVRVHARVTAPCALDVAQLMQPPLGFIHAHSQLGSYGIQPINRLAFIRVFRFGQQVQFVCLVPHDSLKVSRSSIDNESPKVLRRGVIIALLVNGLQVAAHGFIKLCWCGLGHSLRSHFRASSIPSFSLSREQSSRSPLWPLALLFIPYPHGRYI